MNDLNDALDEDDEEESYHFPRSIPVPGHEHNRGDDSDSSDELNQLFVTIYPHEPTASNELKIEVADLIDVLKTSESGWWKGQCLRTQLDGWFPSSYVKVRLLCVLAISYRKFSDQGKYSSNVKTGP